MDRTSLVADPGSELARFEALRTGDVTALADIAGEHLPGLSAFAGCYVADDETEALAVHALEALLWGVDVFAWRCSLRAWLYGLLADAGRIRSLHGAEPAASAAPSPARPVTWDPRPSGVLGSGTGPHDWRDLPWGARWGDGVWDAARAALRQIPLEMREIVWLRDVAGWPERDACDALALTEARGATLLHAGRSRIRDALATLVDAPPPEPASRRLQEAAVAGLLADLAPAGGRAPLPAPLQAAFRRWRARRLRWLWRQFGRRQRPHAPRRGPAAALPA